MSMCYPVRPLIAYLRSSTPDTHLSTHFPNERKSLHCSHTQLQLQHHYQFYHTTTYSTNTMSLVAPPEALYPDIATAVASIQEQAKAHGFAFRKSALRQSGEVSIWG
jgi:hypothetical protein